ncbi:hypothetical protein [Thermolongibacillus altinsuensis]|uniref:hypothetical protein n=1 Tax=Thermolongibacillus altinsuensis TaxID=575256 RepID=UPI0010438C17|nr:hypothetical protein [Thermolongibacillus altinsuensis]GMB09857.1 hypothetical protein B1no1_25670 [Thermolongibacillus altinsuensis]
MPPHVKRMTDKFICLMAFSFGEVAEKLVHVGKLRLSIWELTIHLSVSSFLLLLLTKKNTIYFEI